MSVFPSILTTAAVLIHSVLGCCWHHSHQCKLGHVSGVLQTVEHRECAHHHAKSLVHQAGLADDHRQGQSDGSKPSDDKRCDDGVCSFIWVARVAAKSRIVPMWHAASIDEGCAVASVHRFHQAFGRIDRAWFLPLAPLRAMTQVWRV